MKRSEMLEYMTAELMEILDAAATRNERESKLSFAQRKAAGMLDMMLGFGMAPPCVSEEDRQAIMHVYYAGYTFHQWDEDLEKDEKVMSAKQRRAKRYASKEDPILPAGNKTNE